MKKKKKEEEKERKMRKKERETAGRGREEIQNCGGISAVRGTAEKERQLAQTAHPAILRKWRNISSLFIG